MPQRFTHPTCDAAGELRVQAQVWGQVRSTDFSFRLHGVQLGVLRDRASLSIGSLRIVMLFVHARRFPSSAETFPTHCLLVFIPALLALHTGPADDDIKSTHFTGELQAGASEFENPLAYSR